MTPCKQLSLAEIISVCQEIFENDKPAFLSLLENHINLDKIVPAAFCSHFYASTGRPRKYHLCPMLWALIIQHIFSIPTDSLLIIFLKYSKELRESYGFDKVPNASKFTRFKQDFHQDLQAVFDSLVDITEPIYQKINAELASMTVYDSSGSEAFVKKNNPKYINRTIRRLKSYAKAMWYDKGYDSHKAAYSSMPSHAAANPQVKQLYINEHFCYIFKFCMVTNDLGIVRGITFYNKEFFNTHPDIIVDKNQIPQMKINLYMMPGY